MSIAKPCDCIFVSYDYHYPLVSQTLLEVSQAVPTLAGRIVPFGMPRLVEPGQLFFWQIQGGPCRLLVAAKSRWGQMGLLSILGCYQGPLAGLSLGELQSLTDELLGTLPSFRVALAARVYTFTPCYQEAWRREKRYWQQQALWPECPDRRRLAELTARRYYLSIEAATTAAALECQRKQLLPRQKLPT